MRFLRFVAAMTPLALCLPVVTSRGMQPPPAKAAKSGAASAKAAPAGKPSDKASSKATGKSAGEMDHAAMHAEHMKQMGKPSAAAWAELDAYHALMMATWHPAKDKNDLAPTRAQIGAMVEAAKAVGASKAPTGCATPAMAVAQANLASETDKVAGMVAAKADDAALKAAMKSLHDRFEVLEEGCKTGMKH